MIAGPRRLLRLPAGLLLCALLVACGGAAEETSTASPTGTPPTPASTRTATPTATSTPTEAAPTPTPTTPASTPTRRPIETPATPAATATATAEAPPPTAVLVPAFPGLPEQQRPIALLDVPEHDLFLIVLQEGQVVAVPRDGPYDNPHMVHDQSKDTVCCAEEGLLSVALDPDFARNGYVYAYYSTGTLRRVTRLSRFATTGQGETFAFDASSELVLFELAQPYANHNGGTVLFGPDGMLYLGFGDGGNANDPFRHGQNLTTYFGTIIRIDVRDASPDQPYAIPPDNPFVGQAGGRPEIWAYGLRNPWRMSFDRETGLLWAGDVGQNLVEEVSVIEAGGNYGWNVMEGSRCFSPPQGCDRSGLTLPVWEYTHAFGCSITGGYVYRGEAIPALRGWYLYSDYCNGLVWAIEAETAASRGFLDPVLLWAGGPNAVASFAEDSEGELYVISFYNDRIYRIVAP